MSVDLKKDILVMMPVEPPGVLAQHRFERLRRDHFYGVYETEQPAGDAFIRGGQKVHFDSAVVLRMIYSL
jgi:hypothetical protein